MPSIPPYGTLSLCHLPSRISTRQSPDAVPEASKVEDAIPSPLFHTTRLTPTCCGHAPVLTGRLGNEGPCSFAVRAADGRSIISCGYIESWILQELRSLPEVGIDRAYETPSYDDCSLPEKSYGRKKACGEKGVSVNLEYQRSCSRTTEPPLLVDLNIFVVEQLPSAEATAN